MTNYRQQMGLYRWTCSAAGYLSKHVMPFNSFYLLKDVTIGQGELDIIIQCSWLDARRFPGTLVPMCAATKSTRRQE